MTCPESRTIIEKRIAFTTSLPILLPGFTITPSSIAFSFSNRMATGRVNISMENNCILIPLKQRTVSSETKDAHAGCLIIRPLRLPPIVDTVKNRLFPRAPCYAQKLGALFATTPRLYFSFAQNQESKVSPRE